MDWLKGFDLTLWWNALMAVGVAMLIAGVTAHEHGVTFVALGVIACGFGERLNHVKVSQWSERSIYYPQTLWEGYFRSARAAGVLIEVCGGLLIAFGLYRLAAT